MNFFCQPGACGCQRHDDPPFGSGAAPAGSAISSRSHAWVSRVGRRSIVRQGRIEKLRQVAQQCAQFRADRDRDGVILLARAPTQASTTNRCRSSQARQHGKRHHALRPR